MKNTTQAVLIRAVRKDPARGMEPGCPTFPRVPRLYLNEIRKCIVEYSEFQSNAIRATCYIHIEWHSNN